MKISLFYEFPLPRPWSEDDEHQLFQHGLDEVEAADKAGFSTVWLTEHHFLEEYCHSTAPEMFLAAASQRTKDIRLGFGVMHLPPPINHPARIAERVATLDHLSNGRVEFGTGEGSSVAELEGFNIDPADKRAQWEEALEVAIRCMVEEPFTGFKGEHVEMPARNVIPKPLQKPHPPVWVACTRPSSVQMAAQKAIGALSFAYTGPEALKERVDGYYREFEENGTPITPAMNPNVLAIGGDLSMMVAKSDDEALKRLGTGGGFFSFGIMHYYLTGMRPGRTKVWERYQEAVKEDPTLAYGPGRGAIGSPDTVREFLRGYEASGVDEIILLLNPRSHEGTMESIEIMGKEILPEFIERDAKAVAAKAKRLAPVIEKVEARREGSNAPMFDETYSFGGLPTGRGGKFTAGEIPEAMAEINEGRVKAAQLAKEQEAAKEAAGLRERGTTVSEYGALSTYAGLRVVVTGCASGIGAALVSQLADLGAHVVGLDVRPPAFAVTEFHSVDLSDPESIDAAVDAVSGPVDRLFNVAGVSSGIKDPLRVVTINFLGTRRLTEGLIPAMPPGSAIANVSSLAASGYRENAGVTVGLLDTPDMSAGIEWCERNPDALADGGYRLSKEAIILYGMANVATLGANGIRINCTAPGVTDTPILDQLRGAYGQEFLDAFRTPLGRVAGPAEQASVLVFLNSDAASYITGQVVWVDGGTVAENMFGDLADAREVQ